SPSATADPSLLPREQQVCPVGRVPSSPQLGEEPFFRMSRSIRKRATSFFRRAISACSGFICPCPGNACTGSSVASRTHLRSTFAWIPKSRDACATLTPRALTRFTASSLNSRLNVRLVPIGHLRLHHHT